MQCRSIVFLSSRVAAVVLKSRLAPTLQQQGAAQAFPEEAPLLHLLPAFSSFEDKSV